MQPVTPVLLRNVNATGQEAKSAGGTLYYLTISNNSGAATWAQVYDKAAPVPGTDQPVIEILIPGASSFSAPVGGERGAQFVNAITLCAVTAENGAVGAAVGVIASCGVL